MECCLCKEELSKELIDPNVSDDEQLCFDCQGEVLGTINMFVEPKLPVEHVDIEMVIV